MDLVKGEPVRFIPGHQNHLRRGNFTTIPPIADGLWWVFEHRDYETPCWTWQRPLNKKGYGAAFSHLRRKTVAAHQASYEETKGPIPPGLQIDHLCRNRACVNPEHLEAVTALVNSRRRFDAKLTDEKRADIVFLVKRGYQIRRIARFFGVDGVVIYNVLKVQRRLEQDAENYKPL